MNSVPQEYHQIQHDDEMNMVDDDDNAQQQPDLEDEGEKEDPFQLALDDLEGRVISSLDVVKVHPGVRTELTYKSAQDELLSLLQPLLEVAAHTAASIARTYTGGSTPEAVEATCEEAYNRVVSDLTLPVLLEMSQSDPVASKRVACLEFFRKLFQEFRKPGSWLDVAFMNANAGPYGSGAPSSSSSSSSSSKQQHMQRQPAAQLHRRRMKRLQREGEVLRYWVQASVACMGEGVFTNEAAEAAVASRAIIAAAALIRPSLKHVAQRIQDADDRGASRVFNPTMKMVEGVLNRLFLSSSTSSGAGGGQLIGSERDGEISACIKFVEILCFCCASKPADPSVSSSRRKGQTTTPKSDDFSLEDLPAGHPSITKESLELIAEYGFCSLRGLTLLGGQVRLDKSLLEDILRKEGSISTTSKIVSILKLAAIPYLELEQTLPSVNSEDAIDISIDRSVLDFAFRMTQKAYTISINAVSALAYNRPLFFKEAAICIARRCADPPVPPDDGDGRLNNVMPRQVTIMILSQLKASCLTLLRNSLSVQSGASSILHKVLTKYDMSIQADKALKMAQKATELKSAGRAARNRANMFYEWETSGGADERSLKRRKETDVALAQVREARAARGLGSGIHLSHSMVDAIELALANIENLPKKRPSAQSSKGNDHRPSISGFDAFVDVILSNGASLMQEDATRWFDTNGEKAWNVTLTPGTQPTYELNSGILSGEDSSVNDDWKEQCVLAASHSFGRIATSGMMRKNSELAQFSNNLAGRLAWALKGVPPSPLLHSAQSVAAETKARYNDLIDSSRKNDDMEKLFQEIPVVVSCLSLASVPSSRNQNYALDLGRAILNEAYLQSSVCATDDDNDSVEDQIKKGTEYDACLDLAVTTISQASQKSANKHGDIALKQTADQLAASIQTELGLLPCLSSSALSLLCSMCDIKVPAPSGGSIAASSSQHAIHHAIEKRAMSALLTLRDAAFQRNEPDTRLAAIEAAVGLATGRFQASHASSQKALKLVVNVMYARSTLLSDQVVEVTIQELKKSIQFAYDNYMKDKKSSADESAEKTPTLGLDPIDDDEKKAMDYVRKSILLMVALCIKRDALVKDLFELCSEENAEFASKVLKQDMQRLAVPLGMLHGPAEISMKIAESSSERDAPLLVAFLEALASQKKIPDEDLVELIQACHDIQEQKKGADTKGDPRYIVPVLFAMKRGELVTKLPDFVGIGGEMLEKALGQMSTKLFSSSLLFRQEPDPEIPSLKGMTRCEQLVYLHEIKFESAGLPQKKYLAAILACLENASVFEDRIVMAALDHMSISFASGISPLPLAFMRSCIVVATQRESMRNWMCYTLLPRLVEGKVYQDKRQWEGWMRAAKMLQNDSGNGASSIGAIQSLPPEQLEIYKTRYGLPP